MNAMETKIIRNDVVIQKLGNNIRVLRKMKSITQEELSFRAGVSLSQVARIETGKINTTVSTLAALAKALDTELDQLVKNLN